MIIFLSIFKYTKESWWVENNSLRISRNWISQSKEEYLKNNETLPIKKYSDEECIQQFVDMLTDSHIMLSQIDFQNEKREDKKLIKIGKRIPQRSHGR